MGKLVHAGRHCPRCNGNLMPRDYPPEAAACIQCGYVEFAAPKASKVDWSSPEMRRQHPGRRGGRNAPSQS